ncbi:MAG: transglycosylase domain-containing protein [Microcoleaceae cyanobacterium]
MSSTKPPQKPKTLLSNLTQVVQTLHARVNFSRLLIKPNAKVPEIWVQNADADRADIYPLLGDRYIVGRSSKNCDIVVRNPVVSQVHLCLIRQTPKPCRAFTIRDEDSTNGIYHGRRRVKKFPLRHQDIITLGPPELANGVRLQYIDPPPLYKKVAQYSFLGFCGISAIVTAFTLLEWQKFSVRPLPPQTNRPVTVYDNNNNPLRPNTSQAFSQEVNDRNIDNLDEISSYLPDAVKASEDSRFYWHLGIDPVGILRAFITNLRGGEIREGGSTLSQQLARSIFRDYVGTDDSAGRKLREAIVALKLEAVYNKQQLLLAYINRVYLGLDLYGFEDAAQFYFAKSASELTLSEAATLVGILPAPNTFNPIQNYQLAIEYRDRVIERMLSLGMISSEEADTARRSRIEINSKAKELLQSTTAPYFYDYVFVEMEQLLGSQLAREGNFIVETGLNPRLQTQAENALQNTVNTTGQQVGFSQGGLVTLNTRTGEILTMVGGSNYEQTQFNRAAQALRQPGSTFKVFTYAAALNQGIAPGQSYSCAPFTWQGQNFRGCDRSQGEVDMYRGMALSENITALRIAQQVGLDQVVRMANRLGIQSQLDPVPGLILGQSEVTLLEMTGSFAIIANNGVLYRPHAIRRILDSSDCTDPNNRETCRVIYSYDRENPNPPQLLPPLVSQTMTQLLQGVIRNGTGRSAFLGLGEAGKTGTTNDNVDLWFIGYIPNQYLATGVWLGNDDNSPTNGSSADAARLWADYMSQIVR